MFGPSDFYKPMEEGKCPICGATSIRLLSGFRKRMFGQWQEKYRWQCKECRHQWTTKPATAAALKSAAAVV